MMRPAQHHQQHQWRVVFKRVAVRGGPSTTDHRVVAAKAFGTVVTAQRAASVDGWIQLGPADCPRGTAEAWMLVDGAKLGLGALLVPCIPPPRLVFAGTRAVVVEWNVLLEPMASWLSKPLQLQMRRQSQGGDELTPGGRSISKWEQHVDWAALRPDDSKADGGVLQLRIGGLQPAAALELRLTAQIFADACDCHSPWLQLQTRPARCTPALVGVGPEAVAPGRDAFGRMRGRLDPMCLATEGHAEDCPFGFWMPAELMAGGQNAAVHAFRCGDCAFSPAEHERDPKVAVAAAEAAAAERSDRRTPTAGQTTEKQKQPAIAVRPGPPRSRTAYLALFRAWDESQPGWRRLHQEPNGSATTAVLCTSDIHIDFPDNQKWLRALTTQHNATLILAGDVCTSLEKLETSFRLLVGLYQHVFYVPGNHELWTSKNESNSIDKFLAILALADRCGVHTRPAWVATGVCIIPLFSWYKKTLFGESSANTALSPQEEHFDCACFWPPSIGSAENPHDSLDDGIAEFFLECNAIRFNRADWPRDFLLSPPPCVSSVAAAALSGSQQPTAVSVVCAKEAKKQEEKEEQKEKGEEQQQKEKGEQKRDRRATTVLSFSHFIPRPELYQGYRSMEKVMGWYALTSRTISPARSLVRAVYVSLTRSQCVVLSHVSCAYTHTHIHGAHINQMHATSSALPHRHGHRHHI